MREFVWTDHQLYPFNNNSEPNNFINQCIYWKYVKHDKKVIKNDQNKQQKHQIRCVIIIYESFMWKNYLSVLVLVIYKRLLCARIKYLSHVMELDLDASIITKQSKNTIFIIQTYIILVNKPTTREILHGKKMELEINEQRIFLLENVEKVMENPAHTSLATNNLSLDGFSYDRNEERKMFFFRDIKNLTSP